jgi:3',5'-nucleoside bisphosphate phosphatase
MRRRQLPTAILLIMLWAAAPAGAQVRHEIQFPDLPGLVTLKCDLHMHSVFSDGMVWPTVRVDEAWRLGLDAIALTDHIEYLPHKDDISATHNRSHDLAAGKAREAGLLFPRGTEITRETPPGHFNALFLKDVTPLVTEDFVEAVKQANQQGGFVFWNHQAWKGEENGRWLDVHSTLFENGWLHGMEVCNGGSYYPTAHRWCLEKNLTMVGNSDIHAPDLNQRTTAEEHRTITLVFAKQRTLEALKEALVEGRTAVWFKDQLIGRREFLEPLFNQSVSMAPPHFRGPKLVRVKIHNSCDVEITLDKAQGPGPARLVLPARATSLVKIDVEDPAKPLELSYVATNFLIGPEEGLPVVLRESE